MDTLVVVICNGAGCADIQLVNVLVGREATKFFFNTFNATFHVAVLPRAARLIGAKRNTKPSAGCGVAFAEDTHCHGHCAGCSGWNCF